MSDIIFQPQGTGTSHREGSILVNAPKGIGTGHYNSSNYKMDNYPISIPGVDTGVINSSYSGRFDDTEYYTA